jgi:hypothetical protein
MPQSELRLVKRYAEFIPKSRIKELPRKRRGIYVLYQHRRQHSTDKYDVVYVGMASTGRRGGIRGRLISHSKNIRKKDLWTHFSAFEVWDNIRNDEIAELEGLFRYIYRADARANRLNIQRGFRKLGKIRENNFTSWV